MVRSLAQYSTWADEVDEQMIRQSFALKKNKPLWSSTIYILIFTSLLKKTKKVEEGDCKPLLA